MSALSLLLQKKQTWRQFSNHERRLLSQALFLLPCVALSLKIQGFQRTYALLNKFSCTLKSSPPILDPLFTTSRLFKIATKYHRWAVCLPKSLVLWFLLRCQGIVADLQIGTRFKDGEFQAHAWVEYQGTIVGEQQDTSHPFTSFNHLNQKLAETINLSEVEHPEFELLCCCSRTQLEQPTVARIETLVQKELDWEHLLLRACQQGIFLLLNQNLTCYSKHIPQSIQAFLQDHCQQKTAYNLFLTQKLCQLLEHFQQHHIQVIPFKGSALSANVYHSLVLREFHDIDLLIDAQDFPKVSEILCAQGYYSRIIRHDWEQGFANPEDTLHIDVHWQIAPAFFSYCVDFAQLWDRCQTIFILNQPVKTLSSEDLLLILCTQLLRDAHFLRAQLKQICDIAELIRHTPLDWEFITLHAQSLGLKRSLLFSLAITQQLLEIPLPEEIEQHILKDRVVGSYVTQTIDHLFKPLIRQEDIFSLFQDGLRIGWYRVLLRFLILFKLPFSFGEHSYRVIKHLLAYALKPSVEDKNSIALPRDGYFLYYFIRPLSTS
jgi:hypothetical protein